MEQINWILKRRIVEQWGSQVNFADELGVNEGFLSRVIRGRQKISLELQKAWADRLNCKVSEIFPKE